jgi:hypothetical protein
VIKQVNAFDTGILKKGKGIVVTEKAKSAKPLVYHALILECKLLALEVAYVQDSVVDTRIIKPNDVADGEVKLQLMIPYKEHAPAVNATEVSAK